jgi:hypothetical protein
MATVNANGLSFDHGWCGLDSPDGTAMTLTLQELGYERSYDYLAAFARQWNAGQSDRGNPASKRT